MKVRGRGKDGCGGCDCECFAEAEAVVGEKRCYGRRENSWKSSEAPVLGESWCIIGWVPPGCTDFDVLDEGLEGWEGSKEVKAMIGKVQEKFENIFEAVQVSWGKSGQGL